MFAILSLFACSSGNVDVMYNFNIIGLISAHHHPWLLIAV